jgi:glucokinase
MTMQAQKPIGVVDLGGTKVYSAIVDETGAIIGDDLRNTDAHEGPAAVTQRIVDSLRQAALPTRRALSELQGIGVAAPGPVNPDTGHVISPPNLPDWGHFPLGPSLASRLGLPVVIENDANAAALGEYLAGAGVGAEALIYVTVSTGVGGGIILKGELYRGLDGAAGEIGHMIIEPNGPLCNCAKRGCLEALASGTAIARDGRAALELGKAPALQELTEGDPGLVTAELVAQAAAEGDVDAAAIITRAGTMLGLGLANLVNLLNPDVIVIGGGTTEIGAPFLGPAAETMRRNSFPLPGSRVQLLPARLKYAAIQGMAGLVRNPATPAHPAV